MDNNICLCGCGKEVKKGNQYINGHNKSTLGKISKLKGKTFKEYFGEEKAKEISEKISIGKIGDKNPAKRDDVKIKISKSRAGKLRGEENPKFWKGKKNPGQSQRMKENNPSFRPDVKNKSRERMLEKWRNIGSVKIGKNEKKILDFIGEEFNVIIHRQYPVEGYCLDGYISEWNLAIEIDEKHHYSNNDLRDIDKIRQKIISEKLNCKFIRFKDDISFEEIKQELKRIKR
jgi:very-short-patch-repair endonuclease